MDETPGVLDTSQCKPIETTCARKQGAILLSNGTFAYLLAPCAQQYDPFHILTGATFHIKSIS